jgi:hypothetical protein
MNIQGQYITDDTGRILLPRGYEPGGGVPHPVSGGTGPEGPEGFSLPGRLFSPEEADACFERLRSRGLSFILMPVPWKALEHEGPGIYDEAYLAYLRKILLCAEKRGVSLFILPRLADRWSGEGEIPGWVFEKTGLDPADSDPAGGSCAEAAFFTLFFAGNTFAPEFRIEGVTAQDWLQERYLGAMRHCFRRLKNCAALAGWCAMEAPGRGFIGGEGPGREGAEGRPGGEGAPRLFGGAHFDFSRDEPVCFAGDFLKPFLLRFIGRMREARGEMIILLEGAPGEDPPAWSPEDGPGTAWIFRSSGKGRPPGRIRGRELMGDIPCFLELPSPAYEGGAENLFQGFIETGEAEPSPERNRPCPIATAGIPLRIHRKGGGFSYRFRADPAIDAPTELYIPPAQSGEAGDVSLLIREPASGKIRAWYDREQGKGFIAHTGYRGDIEIVVSYLERKNSSIQL